MTQNPIIMENHFVPGFKASPLLLLGSQTHEVWKNSAKWQAPEDFYLAGLNEKNVAVVRNIDPNYITYFSSLIGNGRIVNLYDVDGKQYLSETILENSWAFDLIQRTVTSEFRILPFLITDLEQKLAAKFNIPLHGSQKIGTLFGTKSGVRNLAHFAHIPVPPGFVCSSIEEITTALNFLHHAFEYAAIKHDISASGFLSQKVSTTISSNITTLMTKILRRPFEKNKDTVVVEGWLENQASIGAHIEILPDKAPVVCAAWQQVIDTDGVSYIGAGPLKLSEPALNSLKNELQKLALALAEKGAVGSFGPDFLITSPEEKLFKPDTAVLIELNARIPYTAFPLEIVKSVRGSIGAGFFSTHIILKNPMSFAEIFTRLSKAKLLITHKNPHAAGVVPFNVGMLPWKSFAIVAMADSWNETQKIVRKVQTILDTKSTHK